MLKTGEEKRNSYNYRDKYLKHNPGFLNSFYLCSQCFRPITKDDLEVDHIFPISRWWAPNHLVNLVSTCRTCNRKKSDKVSFSIQAKGVIVKIIEELYILVHRIFLLSLKMLIFALSYVLNYIKDLAVKQRKIVFIFLVIILTLFVYKFIV